MDTSVSLIRWVRQVSSQDAFYCSSVKVDSAVEYNGPIINQTFIKYMTETDLVTTHSMLCKSFGGGGDEARALKLNISLVNILDSSNDVYCYSSGSVLIRLLLLACMHGG